MKMNRLLLLFLLGCGGQPDGLFAPALTRVNADGGVEAAQEAACCTGDVASADTVADAPIVQPQVESGQDVAVPEAGEAPVDAVAETGFDALPDATCWPPGTCDCPCYRNHAMDGKCLYDARPNAWVCSGCAPQGCAFEYDAQSNLACCPP